MPKKKDITYLQVKSMIDKVRATGERPTLQRIYNLLGDIGSRRQLAEYLQQWRKTFKTDPKSLSKKMSPADINKIVAERTQKLKESLSLVRATLESTADGILLIDNEGRLVDFNQKFVEIARIPKEALEKGDEDIGLSSVLSLLENPEEIIELIGYLKQHPDVQGDMGEVKFIDGRTIERYSQPHRLGKEIVGRVWSFRDVTERRKAQEELRLRERAITASTHGILIIKNDAKKMITYVNPAFEEITKFSAKDVIGQRFDLFLGGEENQNERRQINLATEEESEAKEIFLNRKKNGDLFWAEISVAPVPDPEKEVTHFIAIMNDITEHKALEDQLIYQTTHDALTDLPNKVLLEDRIRQLLSSTSEIQNSGAVLFIDLDRFKIINDSLGHKTGDELLKQIAERLKSCVKSEDTVSRIGGDEFIVLLTRINNIDEVKEISERILNSIRQKIIMAGKELTISASIGITLCPGDSADPNTLIRNADTAMYQVKNSGRNGYQFYETKMNQRVSNILSIENDLHKALENNEFELYYQPVIDLKTHQVVSVESLIRWNHPKRGLVAPNEFINIAEETGMIIPIGEWVLNAAGDQLKKWQDCNISKLRVAVNVASNQMKKEYLLDHLKAMIIRSGINPRNFVLELTENSLITNNKETSEILAEVKSLGVSIAIDDFGVGYSTLNYIKNFPIDIIKIDRVFIRDISKQADNRAIVRAIITMAKNLGLKVIAEGAETQEEIRFLLNNDCDCVQGYFFYKPLPVAKCTQLLLENHGKMDKSASTA